MCLAFTIISDHWHHPSLSWKIGNRNLVCPENNVDPRVRLHDVTQLTRSEGVSGVLKRLLHLAATE